MNTDEEPVSPVNAQTLNNVLDLADPRLTSYTVASRGSSLTSSTPNVQNFDRWSFGEPNSGLVATEQRNIFLSEMEMVDQWSFGEPNSGFVATEQRNIVLSEIEMGAPYDIRSHSGYSSHGGNQAGTPPLSLGRASYNQIPEAVHWNADIASRIDNRQNSGVTIYFNNAESLPLGHTLAGVDNSGSSGGQPTRGSNLGQQQAFVPFGLSGENQNRVFVRSSRQDNSNPSASETVNNIIHHPALTRNIHQLAMGILTSSRTSSSTINAGDGLVVPWVGTNMRMTARNDPEQPMPVSEHQRNPVPNNLIWGSTSGNHGVPINLPFSLQPTAAWIPYQNTSVHDSQRIPEWPSGPAISFAEVAVPLQPTAAWMPYQNTSVHNSQRMPVLPSGPAISFAEVPVPSGSNNRSSRSRSRRQGILSARQNPDLAQLRQLGRRIAADANVRHLLISEMQNAGRAMRRRDNLPVEGNIVSHPYVRRNMPEVRDVYRAMRLDVDNMSYEELIALEEHIGDVNTGLSEETIMNTMTQRTYASSVSTTSQQEPCCICQEEFLEGDEVGSLDCGHEFHSGCIKKWIMRKNVCPICKTIGLSQKRSQ